MLKYSRYVGNLIREIRKAAGISQMQLAEKIGVSYQQVQKYEKGVSEISISRLYQIAEALEVPLTSFLIAEEEAMVSEPLATYGKLSEKEAALIKLFRRIDNKKIRDGLLIALTGIAEALEKK